MKVALMVAGAISFVLATVYLSSMARLASLLQQESGIQGVGMGGPNAQLKLFRIVFFRGLDQSFADRHAGLLASARWSCGVGLSLFLAVFAGVLLGYAE